MKRAIIILSYFLFTLNLYADDIQVVPYCKTFPIAVVIENTPFHAPDNAKAPKAVLYDNGDFVYMDSLYNEKASYKVQKIDSLKLQELINSIGPTHDFLSLKGYYVFADAYDLPTIDIYLSNGHTSKAISLYGVVEKNGSLLVACDGENSNSSIPKEINRVYGILNNIRKENSTKWHPQLIELIIRPYKHSTMKPLPWPDDWPSTKHPLAQKLGDDSYSLFISYTLSKELQQFLDKLKKKQAILIDNKKWSIDKKPAFPNEFIWRQMLNKTDNLYPSKGH